LKLAKLHREFAFEVAKVTHRNVTLADDAINAEIYFRWLKGLLDTGKLPVDAGEVHRKTSS
jgi:hypothetical protein